MIWAAERSGSPFGQVGAQLAQGQDRQAAQRSVLGGGDSGQVHSA